MNVSTDRIYSVAGRCVRSHSFIQIMSVLLASNNSIRRMQCWNLIEILVRSIIQCFFFCVCVCATIPFHSRAFNMKMRNQICEENVSAQTVMEILKMHSTNAHSMEYGVLCIANSLLNIFLLKSSSST